MHKVYLVDGTRTPFLKALGGTNPLSAADLAVRAGQALLAKQPFSAAAIDEVICGCVIPSPDETNIGRIIALRLGCGFKTPGWTVQRNCASGLQAIDSAVKDIALGRADLVLAGGTEAMSRAPIMFPDDFANWISKLQLKAPAIKKIKQLLKFRPRYLQPVIALLKGLHDPVVGMSMGQTAEKLAHIYNISREEMDSYALSSQQQAVNAIDSGFFSSEIVDLFTQDGQFFQTDTGVRRDSNMQRLAKLKPVFDKPFGNVTPGNSSQVTDGAALLLLASEEALVKYNLKPLAIIKDIAWQALDPSVMGLGPAHAIAALLQKNKLNLQDIDYFEINEAFAAQVLACVKVLADPKYCKDNLGLTKPCGVIDRGQLNIDGGAIAIGHPVGASGARISLHLAKILQRCKAKLGIASLCIGGGQGGALLLESL